MSCPVETNSVCFGRVLGADMPAVLRLEDWEKTLRGQVKGLAAGWSVKEDRGRVRIKIRFPDSAEQSVTLQKTWPKDFDSAGDVYVRIRNIYKLVASGDYSLKQAALVAEGKAPKLIEQQDWPGAVKRFKDQKLLHGTAIKPSTWDAKYQPVLSDAVALLTSRNPPSTPAELIDCCIRQWEPGSRTRQERARNLCQFLRHCVDREQIPSIWTPPIDLKEQIGRKPASSVSYKSHPITDQQIINLLASLPNTEAGKRWADVIRLMAELGLRPIELLYLSVKLDPITNQTHWWCSYEKRTGGGITKPRRLWPLPLTESNTKTSGPLAVEWNLQSRWQAKLIKLPPLQSSNGAADSIAKYLKNRPGWQSLKAQIESEDERLSCYSFRHSYSVRGHQRGIDNGSMALAMGHSIEVHCRSYPWATETGAEASFSKANSTIQYVSASSRV